MDRRREPLPTRVQDTPPLPAAFDDALRRGLAAIGLGLEPNARSAVDGHVRLLLAWTRAINLTAITEPAAVAVGHVVDSLTALDIVLEYAPRRLLDLGSGGGFPGVPLAAALEGRPRPTEVTLLEPVHKKARFLMTVAAATGLTDRLRVEERRAEDVARSAIGRAGWDVVTARAVASLGDLVELAFPLLGPGGSLIAWKRGDLTGELAAGRRAIEGLGGGDIRVIAVSVPGLDGHRLVIATRPASGDVPGAFPRDPAARKRRPW